MSTIHCPNCDGPIQVPHHSSTIVCPYCSTTVQVKTGEILKESYVMRVQYTLNDAWDKLLNWATKQLGAPQDLEQKSKIVESEIVYYPFWVIEVEADGSYVGTQKKPNWNHGGRFTSLSWESVEEKGYLDLERDIFIPASADVPKALLDYIIPTKRKEFFSKDMIDDVAGKLRPVQVDREVAMDSAKRIMSLSLHDEAMKEVDHVTRMDTTLKVSAVFLVYIPVWHIKYDFSIRKYNAMVDGASGRVIALKFPRKMAFRAMTFIGGLLHLGVGGGLGLLLVYLGVTQFDGIFPTAIGVVFGLGMLGFALRFLRTAVTLDAEEEVAG
ncbi:MAG: hypothetical protein AM326_02350 [Candidatus Thorarchaeota archaeon SMTZ-45]|nr:MAG: hypothetical protein AM326_02350 [Candidatus Thorarchaeota archaeon SMTZ-45]